MVVAALNRVTSSFSAPFFTGSTPTQQVPHPYHVALAGHPYMVSLDPQANEAWGVRFEQQGVPLLREQTDTSTTVGEQSISPTALWRRSIESWHHGAGQTHYDLKTSDNFRFLSSLNVNVWTQGQLSLLNGISITALSSFGANAVSVVAGSRWYLASGTTLSYITNAVTGAGTAVTGTITGAAVSIATDGSTVYLAQGTGGLLYTDTSSGVITGPYFSGSPNITCVGYAKGRLFVGTSGGTLHNPTAAAGSALSTALVTPGAGAGWSWTAISDGPNAVYAAGFRGDNSRIYALTIQTDGLTLNAAFIAAQLPPGEIVRALYTYSGFVIIGTDAGVRVASPDSSGNLTVGDVIPVGQVLGFTAAGRFVWFTWSNMGGSGAGGTGRLDLSQELSPLVFAYASDLMYVDPNTATSVVARSVVTFLGRTCFTYEKASVTKLGIEALDQPAGAGYVNTGTIGYGIVDQKAAQFVDIRHDPLLTTVLGTQTSAAVGVQLSADNGLYAGLGYSNHVGNTGAGYPFSANAATGETFSLKLTLVPAGVTAPVLSAFGGPTSALVLGASNGIGGTSPVVRRVTLRALQQATRITERVIPIFLRPQIQPETGISPVAVDVAAEREFLEGLYKSGLSFAYQEGSFSVQVTLFDFRWLPERIAVAETGDFMGVWLARLRDVI